MNLKLIFVVLFFFGCSHGSRNYVEQIGSDHRVILAHCELYNLDGALIRQYPGELCVPFENGDLVVSDDKKLSRLNKNNVVQWSHPELVHHHLKKSYNGKDVFFFASHYKNDGKILLRTDSIKVLDENGNLKKYFDFSGYIQRQLRSGKILHKFRNTWTHDEHKNTSYEYTHANSIHEVIRTAEDGSKKLLGYIVNERQLRRVFIFDSELKHIETEIDFPSEVMHDVSFLDPDTIVYYVNYTVEEPNKSHVATFNLTTKEKKILFGDSKRYFFSMFNGGVQPIGHGLFLISHAPEGFRSYLQIINTSGDILKKIDLKGSKKLVQEAKLEDYSQFLKMNVGN